MPVCKVVYIGHLEPDRERLKLTSRHRMKYNARLKLSSQESNDLSGRSAPIGKSELVDAP